MEKFTNQEKLSAAIGLVNGSWHTAKIADHRTLLIDVLAYARELQLENAALEEENYNQKRIQDGT